MSPKKRTPLYSEHIALGARMIPFGEWEMPVQYSGVIDEHKAVREAVGIFDVSHMGEVEITGPGAVDAVNVLIANDLSRAADGQALYTVMCRPDGGIVDDLVVYRFSPERVFICVNASNRDKDFAWIQEHVDARCRVTDRSDEFAQIAVQGPKAAALLATVTNCDLAAISTYHFAQGRVGDIESLISRTGYTGEDGFELYVEATQAPKLWRLLVDAGAPFGARPAGLGARDSLRLEMKYALYGNDIDETTNPYEAGLGWTVKLAKPDFIGKRALIDAKERGPAKKLIGLEMVGRGVARHGYPVFVNQARVGTVTSGTMGPSVQKAIAMAYVSSAFSAPDTRLDIEIRNHPVEAVVVRTPFYRRNASA